jgi:hypothetical protein
MLDLSCVFHISLGVVAHACNPSYLRGWDYGWRPARWNTPVIQAIWEAGIMAGGQPKQILQEIPSPKQPEQNGVEVWFK